MLLQHNQHLNIASSLVLACSASQTDSSSVHSSNKHWK